MEEPPTLFETVHTSIANILASKKKGVDSTRLIQPLIRVMRSGSDYISKEERVACGGAVLLASKFLLSSTTGQNKTERVELIRLFDVCLKLLGSPKNIPSLRYPNLQPILLFDHTFSDTPTTIELSDFINNLLDFINSSDQLSKDFSSPKNLIVLSKLISFFLSILVDSEKDFELRKKSLKLVERICGICRVDALATVLPGVLSKCFNVLKNDERFYEIIEMTLEVFGSVTLKCLEEANYVEEIGENATFSDLKSILVDPKSEEWRKTTCENVKEYLTVICAKLVNHRQTSTKLKLIAMIKKLHKFNELNSIIFDVYLLLNQNSEISRDVEELLKCIDDRSFIKKRLYEKLEELTSQLPVIVRSGSQIESAFDSIVSVLYGLREDIEMLCMTQSVTMINLIRSLTDCIKIDLKRLMITRAEKSSNLQDHLQKFPLQYNIQFKHVEKVSKALWNSELLDLLFNEIQQSSNSRKCSLLLIIAYGLEKCEESRILPISEYFLQLLEQLFDRTVKSDEISMQDDSYDSNYECCLESLICIIISRFVKFFEDRKEKSKKLIEILFFLLLETGSTSWVTSESAQFGLESIGETDSNSVSESISKYGSYIVHRITLASTSSDYHTFAPIVFQQFLDRCDDSSFFDQSVFIVQKLLVSLDSFEQKNTISSLRALRSFVNAVNRWFPDLQPTTIKDESNENEEKLVPTNQMIIVEKVLNRTKHMLSSNFLPIQIVTLEIVNIGLSVIRNYDDFLLPMIHQNWQTLVRIFQSDNICAAHCLAIRVVLTMSQVSRTFIQRKVQTEMWPRLKKFAMAELRKRDLYTQTEKFKFLREILISIPKIFRNAEIDEKDLHEVLEVAKKSENLEIRKLC